MEKLKAYLTSNFEQLTVLVILLSVIFINYAVDEKMVMLNFYYLPVLAAACFIGKRASVLAAMFSILAVILFAILNTEAYGLGRGIGYLISSLCGWGGFLLLASYLVGALFEQKKVALFEQKRVMDR